MASERPTWFEVTAGPRQSGHTTQAARWLLENPHDRAIVVAYDDDKARALDIVMAELDAEMARGSVELPPEHEPEPLPQSRAFYARRIVTYREAQALHQIGGWRPALWVDDALEVVRQVLGMGASWFAGATVHTDQVYLLPGVGAATPDPVPARPAPPESRTP